MSQILEETISGNRIVKAFGMEAFEVRRFREAARRLFLVNLRYVRAQALSSPLMELLGGIMIVGLILIGRGRIKVEALSAGAFLASVFALLIMNQLPKWYHPVFNWERFNRVSDDGFFLVIEARDPKFSETKTRALMEEIGGQHVTLIHD